MVNAIYHSDDVIDRHFELQRFLPMQFELSFFQGQLHLQRRAHPRHYGEPYIIDM